MIIRRFSIPSCCSFHGKDYIIFRLVVYSGLYHGIGSWSCKTERRKPRIAEETGKLNITTLFELISLSMTCSFQFSSHLTEWVMPAGWNNGNAKESGIPSSFLPSATYTCSSDIVLGLLISLIVSESNMSRHILGFLRFCLWNCFLFEMFVLILLEV